MRNRGIGRARMFMGALLLLAAAMTWGIGLTMSPHGEAVAKQTEYLRATVLTYRRNGAIGTLILCALAAWLLFPRRWPKRPVRDWSLLGVLALLAGSSVYTLIRFLPVANNSTVATADAGSEAALANVDENLAMMNQPMNAGIMVDQNSASFNAASASQFERLRARGSGNTTVARRSDRLMNEEQSAEPPATEEQSDARRTTGLERAGAEPSNNDTDGK